MYEKTLKSARRAGAAHANDTELMALFCEDFVPALVTGEVRPAQMWSGALMKGLTARQLIALVAVEPEAAASLQW